MISLTISVYGQRKIKKSEVVEIGFNVSLQFVPIASSITNNGLNIKVTPISPPELNERFLMESGYNGKFEYSYYQKSRDTYFFSKRKKNREKSDAEFLLEGLDWLMENEKISENEAKELYDQIAFKFSEGPIESFSNSLTLTNPYFIADKYLSLFRIEIENTTNTFKKLDNKILVESGSSLLTPLESESIIWLLNESNKMNTDKALTLERYNLKTNSILPPNSKIEKYFAVLPIDYNNEYLNISFEGFDTKIKYNVIKKEKSLNMKYTFYNFLIDWYYSDTKYNMGHNFCIVNNTTSNIYLLNNELFISEETIGQEYEVILFAIYYDKLYFGRQKIKGLDFLNKEKNTRKNIPIKADHIVEIKKVVKQ